MISQKFDPNKPYRYVRYGRMSSKEQNERSPDQQFDEIQRTLDRVKYPWILCHTYRDDGISGRYMAKRPSFMSMIEAIMTGALFVKRSSSRRFVFRRFKPSDMRRFPT